MDQKPGETFIQKPDEREAPPDVLYCWRDPTRVCQGDCTAFFPPGMDPSTTATPCILVNAAKQAASAATNYVRSVAVANVPGVNTPPPRAT